MLFTNLLISFFTPLQIINVHHQAKAKRMETVVAEGMQKKSFQNQD